MNTIPRAFYDQEEGDCSRWGEFSFPAFANTTTVGDWMSHTTRNTHRVALEDADRQNHN